MGRLAEAPQANFHVGVAQVQQPIVCYSLYSLTTLSLYIECLCLSYRTTN